MTKKSKRLVFIGSLFLFVAMAVGLTLTALRGSITYFYMPSDLAALAEAPTNAIRLGGLVEHESVQYPDANDGDVAALVTFSVTDGEHSVAVSYAGLLPDLFREGQGVIVQGEIDPISGELRASNVLAKHDENYMPKEVADALKEKGLFQETPGS